MLERHFTRTFVYFNFNPALGLLLSLIKVELSNVTLTLTRRIRSISAFFLAGFRSSKTFQLQGVSKVWCLSHLRRIKSMFCYPGSL